MQWWFKKFCKGDESLEEEEHSGRPSEVDNDQLRAIIEADTLITTWEGAEELNVNCSTVIQHLKQIRKVKKFRKWVPHELTKNQKSHHFEVSLSLIPCSMANHFSTRLWRVTKNRFYTSGDNQLSAWTEKKLQSQTCTKKGHGSCSVLCWHPDTLQLSESWQNHDIRGLCSANQWDALKTATPVAGAGQQNGPNSSPWQCLTTCCTTNDSNVEPMGLRTFASSAIFTWPLTNGLPLL